MTTTIPEVLSLNEDCITNDIINCSTCNKPLSDDNALPHSCDVSITSPMQSSDESSVTSSPMVPPTSPLSDASVSSNVHKRKRIAGLLREKDLAEYQKKRKNTMEEHSTTEIAKGPKYSNSDYYVSPSECSFTAMKASSNRSWVWNYFMKINIKNGFRLRTPEIIMWEDCHASCNMCLRNAQLEPGIKWSVPYTSSHSPGHLERHLKQYHNAIYINRNKTTTTTIKTTAKTKTITAATAAVAMGVLPVAVAVAVNNAKMTGYYGQMLQKAGEGKKEKQNNEENEGEIMEKKNEVGEEGEEEEEDEIFERNNPIIENQKFSFSFLKWAVLTYVPLGVIESIHFREMCFSLNPNCPIISKEKIIITLKKIERAIKVVLKKVLKNQNVTISVEKWSNLENVIYITRRAHFVSNNWNLINITLSCDVYLNENDDAAKQVRRFIN